MVSRVGNDQLGTEAIAQLRKHGVDTENVTVSSSHPTGTVSVELDAAGKPSFSIGENVAWDHFQWSELLERLAPEADAVCFGTLGQRSHASRAVIRQFVSKVPRSALRVLDVNLRPPFDSDPIIAESLPLANVLKLSDEELERVAGAGGLSGSEETLLRDLSDRFDLQLIALTRGPKGATLYRAGQRSDVDGVSVDVKDTVGAGDSYTARMIVGLLADEPLDVVNRQACQVAAYVCSQSGATPALPDELRR
jgi:fructokinase